MDLGIIEHLPDNAQQLIFIQRTKKARNRCYRQKVGYLSHNGKASA
jgi:hypothetical protein